MTHNKPILDPVQPPRRKWKQAKTTLHQTLLGCVFACLLPILPLQAQPDKIETLPRRTERIDGVPFNTPICAKVDDDYFQAPAVWFREMKPGIVNDIPKVAPGEINGTRIGIRFWLPDFRVLEGVEYMGTQHAPRENGRPKPGPDQRVVGIGYFGKIAEPARDHMYFYVEKKYVN